MLTKNKFYDIGYTKLLVGGGDTQGGTDGAIKIEIVDLESSTSNCSSLEDFPEPTNGAIGGLEFDDNPVICGGAYKQECFSWRDSAWQVFHPLNSPRYNAASCLSPYAEKSHKLFVVGGSDQSGIYR